MTGIAAGTTDPLPQAPPSPVSTDRRHHAYELLLLVMAVIWGTAFVAQQIGMQRGIGPMTFNALRFGLGSLSLIPLLLWRKRSGRVASIPVSTSPAGRGRLTSVSRQPGEGGPALQRGAGCHASSGHALTPALSQGERESEAAQAGVLPVRPAMLAGLFLFAAAAFQQIGLQYTTSANGGFITGLYLVFVPLVGLGFGHRAGRGLWVGVALCVIGLYLLSVTGGMQINKGDALVLAGALMWTGQILVIDRAVVAGAPIKIAIAQFVVCAVLSAAAALAFEMHTFKHIPDGTGAVLYAGLLSVGVAFTLQVICQKRVAPGPAAVLMSMEAVFAAIAGWLVLDQTLSPRALVGCGLMFAGVLAAQLSSPRKQGART